MISSCLDVSKGSGAILSRKSYKRSLIKNQSGWSVSFVITFFCIIIATICATEKPNQMASICEKYNSEIACQVW